jgi:psp operon transcriptional activator
MRARTDGMLGDSTALAEALDHLSLLAAIDRPVLVLGERGTGKELAAERLHFLSPRWEGPFVKINCAAMAEGLLESELFGHEAGAFTGASRQHTGRFERAEGGTLLLDEIGMMSPRLQEKLLRTIEYGEFERLGGSKTRRADVRVIASTNANLRAMTEDGSFRHDLLDRLSFDVVHLPPLRARGGDIMLLAEHFAIGLCAELGWALFPGFSSAARAALVSHHWPGNVRELKNAVERSLFRWGTPDSPVGRVITDPFLSPYNHPEEEAPTPTEAHDAVGDNSHTSDLRASVDRYERELLQTALLRSGYNQRRCAETLGLTYNQIRGLVRKHSITSRPAREVSTQ